MQRLYHPWVESTVVVDVSTATVDGLNEVLTEPIGFQSVSLAPIVKETTAPVVLPAATSGNATPVLPLVESTVVVDVSTATVDGLNEVLTEPIGFQSVSLAPIVEETTTPVVLPAATSGNATPALPLVESTVVVDVSMATVDGLNEVLTEPIGFQSYHWPPL